MIFVLHMCETVVALDMKLTRAGLFETPGEWLLWDYQPNLSLPDWIWEGISHHHVECPLSIDIHVLSPIYTATFNIG